MARPEQSGPEGGQHRQGAKRDQPWGDRLQVRMPNRLLAAAITVFQPHPHDQRVLDLTHRMRRLCRRILGVASDADAEKVILDAIKKLPRLQDSWEFNGRILSCNRLRNRIVHEDYHATIDDVQATESAWKEFKGRACAFLGIPEPPMTVAATVATDDKDSEDSIDGSPRTLWSQVIHSAEKGVTHQRNSLENLVDLYESAILDVFRRFTNGHEPLAKAQCSAFCQSLQTVDCIVAPSNFSSFRAFLATTIMDFELKKQPRSVASGHDRENVLRWLTQTRARQLYLEALEEARDRCGQNVDGEAMRKLLEQFSCGRLSLDGLRHSSTIGQTACHNFLDTLHGKVRDEVHISPGQDATTMVNRELTSFFEALSEDATS